MDELTRKPEPTGLMQKAKVAMEQKKNPGLLAHIAAKQNNSKTEGGNNMPAQEKVIIQQDGVFVIKSNLETSKVKQDPELKTLIDSVLRA